MNNSQQIFKGTDWINLVVAIDIIGDMIAYWCHQRRIESNKTPSSAPLLQEIDNTILRLGAERLLVYNSGKNHSVIIKAYTEYGPFLKKINKVE